MIPYLLAAAFCIALGYLLRMLSEEEKSKGFEYAPGRRATVVPSAEGIRYAFSTTPLPEDFAELNSSSAVDLPVGVRRHPRLVRSE